MFWAGYRPEHASGVRAAHELLGMSPFRLRFYLSASDSSATIGSLRGRPGISVGVGTGFEY